MYDELPKGVEESPEPNPLKGAKKNSGPSSPFKKGSYQSLNKQYTETRVKKVLNTKNKYLDMSDDF